MSECLNKSDQRKKKDIQYAKKLMALRRKCKRKWTEREISTNCGTNDLTVRGWFNGFSRPNDQQKAVLAKMFGCGLKELEYI